MKFGYVTEPGNKVHITHPLTQGGIVAVYYLPGTLVGALLGGWIGEKIGRIRTIALGAAWAIIGASLQCSAQNANWYDIKPESSSRNDMLTRYSGCTALESSTALGQVS